MCRCPAHDDRNPSLSVSKANGRLLVHCHAGCTQDAVIGELKRLGL
jgi:putative DNA primase/helicase